MAITFIPYFNNIGVSYMPEWNWNIASRFEVENLPDVLLPAFNIKTWFDSAVVGASYFLADIGNYTYIDAYKFNSSQVAINIHYNNSIIGRQELYITQYESLFLAWAGDYDNNIGYCSCVFEASSDRGYLIAQPFVDIGSQLWAFVYAIQPTPPVNYDWKSVPVISGKIGVFNLGAINNTDIGDGSTVSDANLSVINQVPNSARLKTILANVALGQTIDWAFSGNNYKMSIKNGGTILQRTYTFYFYLQQTTPGTYTAFYSFTTDPVTAWDDYYVGIIIDEESEVAALSLINVKTNAVTGDRTVDYCIPGASMSTSDMELMYIWVKGSASSNDALDSFVDNEGDGGGDLVNRVNNPIPTPGVPTLSAYDSGFMSQYKVDKNALKDLSDYLWTNSFVENLPKFFNDPMQIIIGLTIYPLIPKNLGTSRVIKGGGISTGVSGEPLTNEFCRYDFGECVIEKRLQNKDYPESGIYFDYAPYTECKIYLPYCGEHSLDLNDVMGKKLALAYTVDFVSGVCCAHLTITDADDSSAPEECHYNFCGQMGVNVPVSQADYSSRQSAILSTLIAGASGIATIATGGLTAPLSGAAAKAAGVDAGTKVFNAGNAVALGTNTASRLANNVANMAPTVQHTSGGGAVSGSLSSEYPYVTISEPDVFDADNQKHYKGYPINGTYKIGDMSGFIQIDSVHLDGLSCTESERNSIRDALIAGVIVNKVDTSETPDHSAPTGELAIVFLKNKSDPDTIGKHFTDANKVTGKLLYSQDINHVRVRVSGNFSAYNYCYIHDLGRYYFINTFEIETGYNMVVDMESDPLQSFKDEILDIPALIDSGEDKSKAKFLMNNGYWFMKQKRTIKTLTFKKDGVEQFFDRSSSGTECFVLTIAGD